MVENFLEREICFISEKNLHGSLEQPRRVKINFRATLQARIPKTKILQVEQILDTRSIKHVKNVRLSEYRRKYADDELSSFSPLRCLEL